MKKKLLIMVQVTVPNKIALMICKKLTSYGLCDDAAYFILQVACLSAKMLLFFCRIAILNLFD